MRQGASGFILHESNRDERHAAVAVGYRIKIVSQSRRDACQALSMRRGSNVAGGEWRRCSCPVACGGVSVMESSSSVSSCARGQELVCSLLVFDRVLRAHKLHHALLIPFT